MPALNFHWRSFWWLVCSFTVIVPVGTLLHESAHYVTARILGFEGYITYQSTLYTKLPGEGQALLDKRLLVTMAGPLQTMFTRTSPSLEKPPNLSAKSKTTYWTMGYDISFPVLAPSGHEHLRLVILMDTMGRIPH